MFFALFGWHYQGRDCSRFPCLPGSAAFAVGEAFDFHGSLEDKPSHAKRFYGVLIFATLLGMLLIYVGLNPIRALFWSAVINGIHFCADHGRRDADGFPSENHGRIHDLAILALARLGSYRCDACRRDFVLSNVIIGVAEHANFSRRAEGWKQIIHYQGITL